VTQGHIAQGANPHYYAVKLANNTAVGGHNIIRKTQ